MTYPSIGARDAGTLYTDIGRGRSSDRLLLYLYVVDILEICSGGIALSWIVIANAKDHKFTILTKTLPHTSVLATYSMEQH
jgi:hypothetical protein